MSDSFLIAASTLSASARQARVDDQHAVLADLHGDVAAGADEQIHVALHLERMDLAAAAPVLRRGGRGLRARLRLDAPAEGERAGERERGERVCRFIDVLPTGSL